MKHHKNNNSNKIWIYGQHACFSALANDDRKLYKVLAYEKYADEIIKILEQRADGVSTSIVSICDKSHIEKFLPEDSIHQGFAIQTDCLLTADLNIFTAKLNSDKKSCVLILDQVTDTRNIGSIIRSAVAFEVDAIIFTKTHFPKENGMMVKAAAGGFEKINLIEVSNLSNAIEQLKKDGFWIIGLDAHTDTYLHQIDSFPKTALILGSEDKGMRDLTKKSCDFLAKIPMNSVAMESLNISNATAVALYEIYKKSI